MIEVPARFQLRRIFDDFVATIDGVYLHTIDGVYLPFPGSLNLG